MASISHPKSPKILPTEKPRQRDAAHPHKPPHWTFLSNHAYVLIELHNNPEQVLREVARKVGITERAVQRIVQELEEEGYLIRERVGRRNRYRLISGRPLRHPLVLSQSIDDLLQLMISESETPEQSRVKECAIREA